MIAGSPYERWSTRPDPKWGYPRGVFYGQDAVEYLEALGPEGRLTYGEHCEFIRGCGASIAKHGGGVPLGEAANLPAKDVGNLVAAIRQHYGQLEQAARLVAEAPRYVPEPEFPIPLDWGLTEVLRYLLSLSENTLIVYERAYLYLRHCGIEDAHRRLHPRFDVRRGPPGKEVGKLIEIIREFEAELQRKAAPINV